MLNAPKIAPTNATIRVNPHGYSYRPFRLFASPISTIRLSLHDYSCKPSRLLALTNDTKKSPEAEAPGQVSVIKTIAIKQCSWS